MQDTTIRKQGLLGAVLEAGNHSYLLAQAQPAGLGLPND